MNKIPPLDLTEQYESIREEVESAVTRLLASGLYIGGEAVTGFEQAFANYIGVAECVSCNSGTDALFLALRALGIGPGDEVITSAFTFFATAEVVSAVGATPVFVDLEPDGFNLDLTQIEAAITARTRAVIPVHLFGQPVNMTELMAIAQRHHLAVVEDCAQAAGAAWAGQRVGSQGHIGCFSFFPTKNLGACGDGGAITTSDPAIAAKIRMLREHGMPRRYYHEEIGVTSRLDAIQAVILSIKLKHLNHWNQQRQAIAQRYSEWLSPLSGFVTPTSPRGGSSVWHQYTLRICACDGEPRCWQSADPMATMSPCDRSQPGHCRDWVKQQLAERGISSMIYYPIPLHRQQVYLGLGYEEGSLPRTEQAAREVLSLPMFPELAMEQQQSVVLALKQCGQPASILGTS